MITLKEVSSLSIFLGFIGLTKSHPFLIDLETFKDSFSRIETHTYINFEKAKRDIEYIEQLIDEINKRGLAAPIYYSNDYSGFSDLKKNSLINTDKVTSSSNLILNVPTIDYRKRGGSTVSNFSIFELKHLLSHVCVTKTSPYVKNALQSVVSQISDKNCIKILNAVRFYEEQLFRQVHDLDYSAENVFTINKEQKEILVNEQYRDIIYYLVENGNVYVWGKSSNTQRKRLLESINPHDNFSNVSRENVVDIISNYTTLSELEKGVSKSKVLDRFIIS